MYQISEILGKEDRAAYYKDLTEKIRLAFHSVYITKDKRLLNELQGLYVMAIAFGMVQDDTKRIFERRLEALVKAADYHLATGFLSTPFLLDVLWDAGFHDTACKVLYQDTCPSWLYGVKMGATTIWENWEGIVKMEVSPHTASIIMPLAVLQTSFTGGCRGKEIGIWLPKNNDISGSYRQDFLCFFFL